MNKLLKTRLWLGNNNKINNQVKNQSINVLIIAHNYYFSPNKNVLFVFTLSTAKQIKYCNQFRAKRDFKGSTGKIYGTPVLNQSHKL